MSHSYSPSSPLVQSLMGQPCNLSHDQAPRLAQVLVESLSEVARQAQAVRTPLQGSVEPLARFEGSACRWMDARLSRSLATHLSQAGLALTCPLYLAHALLRHLVNHPLEVPHAELVHISPQVLALNFAPA